MSIWANSSWFQLLDPDLEKNPMLEASSVRVKAAGAASQLNRASARWMARAGDHGLSK